MISDDAVVQVSATVILGVLVLISVAQSLKLHGAGFGGETFKGMYYWVIIPFVSAAIIGTLGWSQFADWVFIVSFVSMLIFLGRLAFLMRKLDKMKAAKPAGLDKMLITYRHQDFGILLILIGVFWD